MAPTRERPGIVRVRISDREVWHVVDPALSPTEAAEAVRAHRAANAPTNRTAPRRVLAWTPGLVALVVLAAAVVGTVVVTRELDLDLDELPARITVAAALGLVGFIVAAVAGIALLDAPWRRDEPAPGPQRSPHVVPVDDAVRRWATDGVPAADVWRVVGALALVGELEAARWRLSDCLYGRLDAGAAGGEDPADDDVPDVGAGAVPGEHPAETALWAARARAEEALVAVGEEVGYPTSSLIRHGTDQR